MAEKTLWDFLGALFGAYTSDEATSCGGDEMVLFFGKKYSGKGKSVHEERQEAQRWLDLAAKDKLNPEDINAHLVTRTYFVAEAFSIADAAVVFEMHKFVSELPPSEYAKFCCLLRWFDHVQHLKVIRECGVELPLVELQFPVVTTLTKQPVVAQKAKKTKKKQKKAPAKKAEPATAASSDIFSKIEIRVGRILKAWKHPESTHLICEEIDLAEPSGPRSICSGLQEFYAPEEIVGRLVLVVSNLKPRPFAGFSSHGMVMCGSEDDHGKVELIEPPADTPIGERVIVAGFEGEPASAAWVTKKKAFDKAMKDMKTNEEAIATYKGVPFTVSTGVCKCKTVCGASLG